MTTCFTNPGTSEMHFVAPLDSGPEMPAVLASFEGVATGAAVGHALHRASHNLAPASHDLARLAPNLLADRSSNATLAACGNRPHVRGEWTLRTRRNAS